MVPMECKDIRVALSARLDGERAPLSDDIVDAHAESCESCQRWLATITSLREGLAEEGAGARGSGGEPAGTRLNDLLAVASTNPVAVETRRRGFPLVAGRIVLSIVAVGYLLWSVLLLFSPSQFATSFPGAPAPAFFNSDAAVVRFALGIGLLWAVWKPKAAIHMLPIYLALWAFGAGLATRDVVVGVASATTPASVSWIIAGLALSLLSVFGLLLMWIGRMQMVSPLRQSWRALLARPVTFSPEDLARNSTFRPGE